MSPPQFVLTAALRSPHDVRTTRSVAAHLSAAWEWMVDGSLRSRRRRPGPLPERCGRRQLFSGARVVESDRGCTSIPSRFPGPSSATQHPRMPVLQSGSTVLGRQTPRLGKVRQLRSWPEIGPPLSCNLGSSGVWLPLLTTGKNDCFAAVAVARVWAPSSRAWRHCGH